MDYKDYIILDDVIYKRDRVIEGTICGKAMAGHAFFRDKKNKIGFTTVESLEDKYIIHILESESPKKYPVNTIWYYIGELDIGDWRS